MRVRQNPAVPLYQLGVYAKDPALGLKYTDPRKDFTSTWAQLRLYVISIIQEELKYGPLPPASKYYVLDQLIADKFPPDINPLKLVELEDKIYNKLPKGKRLANLPGICEIGRAAISFDADICVIDPSTGTTTVIDIVPADYENELGLYLPILEAKYWLMESYVDDITYFLFSPIVGDQIRRRKVIGRPYMKNRLCIQLQYWYTGIVNEIAIKEEQNEESK